MQSSISSSSLNSEAEAEAEDETTRFHSSLLELTGLRSQLHQAADYCESTFLNTKEKNEVVENTKKYICRAMVTVIDHLGNVTSNLESSISQANASTEVELRLNCLKQRLFSCEQYAQKLALSKVRWSEILPRYQPHYLSTVGKNAEKANGSSRDFNDPSFAKTEGKPQIVMEKPMPLLLYKFYTYNQSPAKNLSPGLAPNKDDDEKTSALVPVRDSFSIQSKGLSSTFHFQVSQKKHGRHRKSKLGSDIFSLIRRTNQIT